MASPVSREGFFYSRDTLYVQVGSNIAHRHPRCDSWSLHSLLTYVPPSGPVLTKAGKVAKRQPLPHKDSPAHFYEAQCIHYGLHPYKTKEAAKKHLLDAFDPTTQRIEVPAHIKKLEEELKEEYKKAEDVSKKKREDEKQRALELAKQKREKKNQADEVIFKEFEAAGIVISKGGVPGIKAGSRGVRMNDDQLRKELDALSEGKFRAMMYTLLFEDEEHSFKKFKRGVSRELEVIKAETRKKKELAASKGKGKGRELPPLLADTCDNRGEYLILAPYLQGQWPQYTDKMFLKMSLSNGQSHLWCSFDFGIYDGVMRSKGALPRYVGDTVEFHWKGGAPETSETYFGEDNVVLITFEGQGRIRGRMRAPACGTFEFIGKKQPKNNVVWVMSVEGWKSRYRGINEGAYEAANRARWGGWYDSGDARDRTPNSDTETEDEDSSEEDEEDREDYYKAVGKPFYSFYNRFSS